MAASLETCALMLALCRRAHPTQVTDLGSGFSSYVLRLYASTSAAEVTSVDDSPEWLSRTSEFIPGDLRSGRFEIWPVFRDAHDEFGLVFHDFAGGALREEAMRVALDACAPGGIVIFDDAQHVGHRRRMRSECRRVGARLFALRWCTFDDINRWAMIAVK
jgi:predicted O-methyltransferase YrrM